MKEEIFVNKSLTGIGVSSGITSGRVRLIDRGKVAITKRSITQRQVDREVARIRGAVQGASCIEKGLTCVLNGTPCCAPYECKGKFPNTTCR